MYYWRAAVKHKGEKQYTLVYFATEQLDNAIDVTEMLEGYGLQTHNGYFRHLSKIDFICNALLSPIATVNTFQKYHRAVLIG